MYIYYIDCIYATIIILYYYVYKYIAMLEFWSQKSGFVTDTLTGVHFFDLVNLKAEGYETKFKFEFAMKFAIVQIKEANPGLIV